MYVDGLRDAIGRMTKLNNTTSNLLANALNRVGEGVRTEVPRKVSEIYHIKSKDVKDKIRLQPIAASGAGAAYVGDVVVSVRSNAIPLIKFKSTPKLPAKKKPNKPVTVSVKRNGGGRLRTGFLARMDSGHVGIYRRKFDTGQSGRARRKNAKGHRPELPVMELHGPSVPSMLEEPGVLDHIHRQAKERMDKRLDHEFKRVLGVGTT